MRGPPRRGGPRAFARGASRSSAACGGRGRGRRRESRTGAVEWSPARLASGLFWKVWTTSVTRYRWLIVWASMYSIVSPTRGRGAAYSMSAAANPPRRGKYSVYGMPTGQSVPVPAPASAGSSGSFFLAITPASLTDSPVNRLQLEVTRAFRPGRFRTTSRDHAILRRAMRLLIVEDELDLATALATGLRREGYAIDTAANAAEARRAPRGRPIRRGVPGPRASRRRRSRSLSRASLRRAGVAGRHATARLDADRPGWTRRSSGRPGRRGRRLPRQAVQLRGARGTGPRPCPPPDDQRRRGDPAGQPRARRRAARGPPQRPTSRPHRPRSSRSSDTSCCIRARC